MQNSFLAPENDKDEVSFLHLVNESKELAGVVRDGPWLLVRIGVSDRCFEGFTIRVQLRKITHRMPSEGVVSENSNRPAIMRHLGSSSAAILLTALDIQPSLHLSKLSNSCGSRISGHYAVFGEIWVTICC